MPIITRATEVSTITLDHDRRVSISVCSDRTLTLTTSSDLFGLSTTQARHLAAALREAADMADAITLPWSETV